MDHGNLVRVMADNVQHSMVVMPRYDGFTMTFLQVFMTIHKLSMSFV